jgi:hypothetical protein
MSQKINPVVAIVIAAVALIAVIFVGVKLMGGSSNDGGSEGKAVVVKPANPNDPKFTEHLPKGIAGGGLNTGGQ